MDWKLLTIELNQTLLGLILLSTFYLSLTKEIIAVFVLGFLFVFYWIVSDHISYELTYYYYWCAALTDLLIIYILSKIPQPTKMIKQMIFCCVLFAVVNCLGWVAFESSISSLYYNILCATLYASIFFIIGKQEYARTNAMDHWNKRVFDSNHHRNYLLQASERGRKT